MSYIQIESAYDALWDGFKQDLNKFRDIAGNIGKPTDNNDIHELVNNIWYKPKHTIRDYVKEQMSRQADVSQTPEPGSISGFFFEELIYALVVNNLPKGIEVYRNNLDSSDSAEISKTLGITKPDIYLVQGTKHVVLELKVALSTNNFKAIESSFLRLDQIKTTHTVKYYVIAAHSTLNKSTITKYQNLKWICTFHGTNEILREQSHITLDQILFDITSYFCT